MKSFSAPLVALAVFVAGASAQFQINTPNPPVQCVPIQFTWNGGNPPFFLQIVPGGIPGAAALQQYAGLTGNSFTWSSNISAGTSIGLSLTDNSGSTVQSAPVTIQSGPSNSCLNGAASSSSGTSPATSAGTAGTSSATTPAGTSPATSTHTSESSSSATSKSTGTGTGTATAGSSSNTNTSGASSTVVSAGLIGVLGAVAAAILA